MMASVAHDKSVIIHRHKNRKYYDTVNTKPVNLTEIFSLYRQNNVMVTTKPFGEEPKEAAETVKKKELDISEDTILQAIFKVCLDGRFENKKTRKNNPKVLDDLQLTKLRHSIMECVKNI